MWSRNDFRLGFASILTAAIATLLSRSAWACGGCFCPTTGEAIIRQSEERLVFEVSADGAGGTTVTAHVQIAYLGSEDAFAWVVPVPSLPRDVDTSSSAMFDELDAATAPIFHFRNRDVRGSGSGGSCGGGTAPAAAAPASDEETASEVTVWSREAVGPYDVAIVSSADGGAIYDWLDANGYEIPLTAEPILDAYAFGGSYFLAMQLREDADVSQIEPIRFTYDGEEPCIPLRLTAIASVADLYVLAYAFGDGRVLPDNYGQAEPDLDRLQILFQNDFGTVTNYAQLVMDSADALGGRAFVTELSAPTAELPTPVDATLAGIVSRHPHLTRFVTRISPEEMTEDPRFRIDLDAPDVSNEHTIDRDAEVTHDAELGDTSRDDGCRIGGGDGARLGLGVGWAAAVVALALRRIRRR